MSEVKGRLARLNRKAEALAQPQCHRHVWRLHKVVTNDRAMESKIQILHFEAVAAHYTWLIFSHHGD